MTAAAEEKPTGFQVMVETPIQPKPEPVMEIPGDLEAPPVIREASTVGDAVRHAQRVYTPPSKPAGIKRPVGRPPGSGNKPKQNDNKPKVPEFDEWQDFIGTLVIRWLCRAYLTVALSGVRDMMTDEENEDLEFDDEELTTIAKPFAHLIERTKFNKKYGRTVMESRDAIEASVMLFMWSGRVARIRTKYKGKHRKETDSHVQLDAGTDVQGEAQVLSPQFGNGIRPTGVGFN